MTKDQIRIAIGEACGFVWYRIPKDRLTDRRYRFLALPAIQEYEGQSEIWKERADGSERLSNMDFMEKNGYLPRYDSDLNAMRDAEEQLSNLDHQKMCLFLHKLIMGTLDNFDVNGTCNLECISRVVKATAAQRAEAFLRAIERWKDDDATLPSNNKPTDQ
jgi:hypothetical protein